MIGIVIGVVALIITFLINVIGISMSKIVKSNTNMHPMQREHFSKAVHVIFIMISLFPLASAFVCFWKAFS